MPGRTQPDDNPPRSRRHDPERRDRIVDVCLDVIATHGVAGTSHRRVAAAAGVPLGSMTYHFSGMDELLRTAFDRFSDEVADRFERRMAGHADPAAARAAVVDLVTHDVFRDDRDLVLTLELYSLAARDPSYRTITAAWTARTRSVLERYFGPATARLLDAMIEGLTIHRALDGVGHDPGLVATAIARLTDAQGSTG